MSKKTRKLTNKAGKLMKCDGKMLKKVIEAKGYKCHELSKMLRYCSDYLTTCCRTNKISDVAAKYLMDYKIFPQMYDLEGEIETDDIVSPTEVKIDIDDKEAADKLNKRMDMINNNSVYGMFKSDKEALAQEAKEILNRRSGRLEKEIAFGTPYGIIRSEKDLRTAIKHATSPKAPVWRGSNLIIVREILEKAYNNGLKYNVEDMRDDLLVYASNAEYPETWVHFVERLNLVNDNNSLYEAAKDALNVKTCQKAPFAPTAQEIKKILNEKYGAPKKGVEGIDYGYGPTPKNTSYCSFYAAGHDIAKGVFKLMQATIDDLKHDPEFKEMIKQAVKEAYEEL